MTDNYSPPNRPQDVPSVLGRPSAQRTKPAEVNLDALAEAVRDGNKKIAGAIREGLHEIAEAILVAAKPQPPQGPEKPWWMVGGPKQG